MTRLPLVCMICHSPLSGGLDTFSFVGEEMCWDCYSSFLLDAPENDLRDWALVSSKQEIADNAPPIEPEGRE